MKRQRLALASRIAESTVAHLLFVVEQHPGRWEKSETSGRSSIVTIDAAIQHRRFRSLKSFATWLPHASSWRLEQPLLDMKKGPRWPRWGALHRDWEMICLQPRRDRSMTGRVFSSWQCVVVPAYGKVAVCDDCSLLLSTTRALAACGLDSHSHVPAPMAR